MLPKFLLASFPFFFFASLVGGLLLLVAGSRRKFYADHPDAAASEVARSIALFAWAWSAAMGIFIVISTDVVAQAGWVPLLVPLALCVPPLLNTGIRMFVVSCALCSIIYGVLCGLAGFSIGTAFTPAAALLALAGWVAFMLRRVWAPLG